MHIKLYLIRHGESTLNIQEIHQTGDVLLSEEGKRQATRVGKRLTKIPIDALITSPFERAKQTAQIIGNAVGKPITISELFVELKRPTHIEGKPINDPQTVEIKNKIMDNWNNSTYHYSDEENFFDLKMRAIKALDYVNKLQKESVIHAEFIRILLSIMIFGEALEANVYKKVRKALEMSNTGITLCTLENGTWKLQSWNDHSYLKNALVTRYKS